MVCTPGTLLLRGSICAEYGWALLATPSCAVAAATAACCCTLSSSGTAGALSCASAAAARMAPRGELVGALVLAGPLPPLVSVASVPPAAAVVVVATVAAVAAAPVPVAALTPAPAPRTTGVSNRIPEPVPWGARADCRERTSLLAAAAAAAASCIAAVLWLGCDRDRCLWKRLRTALHVRPGSNSLMMARHLNPCLMTPCRRASSSAVVHGSSVARSRVFSSTGFVRRMKRFRTEESLRPGSISAMTVHLGPYSETRRKTSESSNEDHGSWCTCCSCISLALILGHGGLRGPAALRLIHYTGETGQRGAAL